MRLCCFLFETLYDWKLLCLLFSISWFFKVVMRQRSDISLWFPFKFIHFGSIFDDAFFRRNFDFAFVIFDRFMMAWVIFAFVGISESLEILSFGREGIVANLRGLLRLMLIKFDSGSELSIIYVNLVFLIEENVFFGRKLTVFFDFWGQWTKFWHISWLSWNHRRQISRDLIV